MTSSLLPLLAGAAVGGAWAACPGGGLSMHDRCWYLGEAGASCAATCQGKGLSFSHYVAGEASPMVPKLLGRDPGTRQFPWARMECYVPGSDRYHTAKAQSDGNAGDKSDPGAWSEGVCRLACSCTQGAGVPAPLVTPSAPYPGCVGENSVMRHAGSWAIFLDVTAFGSAGCWQNDCKNSDKFNSDDMGVCARACAQTDECTHWSFGEQENATKCFLRKSDAGRELTEGFKSAAKACAPPALPDAFIAHTTAKMLASCDVGKSDACPDMARVVTTWRMAISHLKRATAGEVDASTTDFVNQVSDEIDAFAAQMSKSPFRPFPAFDISTNFPILVGNSRAVFNALYSWLDAQPTAVVNPNDVSLPNPLRGYLCGASSCYEKVT